MKMRSWLFVPGDSERKLAKAATTGADAVIVDLEDAVADHAKSMARMQARDWLQSTSRQVTGGGAVGRWVRINPIGSRLWRDDLATVMAGQPDGVVVPKSADPEQLRLLAAELYEHEQRAEVKPGSTLVIPQVGETASGALSIADYASDETPRLGGLTWGAEDLANAIGAKRKRDKDGNWTDVFRFVRTQMLLTAHVRKVPAIDTLYADFRDLAGLQSAAESAFADGFTGMLAIHPDQVPVINRAFVPHEDAIAEAQAIVDAFAANPGVGALQLDGRMIEQPHLEQARRLLESLH